MFLLQHRLAAVSPGSCSLMRPAVGRAPPRLKNRSACITAFTWALGRPGVDHPEPLATSLASTSRVTTSVAVRRAQCPHSTVQAPQVQLQSLSRTIKNPSRRRHELPPMSSPSRTTNLELVSWPRSWLSQNPRGPTNSLVAAAAHCISRSCTSERRTPFPCTSSHGASRANAWGCKPWNIGTGCLSRGRPQPAVRPAT